MSDSTSITASLREQGIVAHSRSMQIFTGQLEKVIRVDHTVLLTGESGTGKSQIAKLIHRLGKRSAGPLISVNCAAIPQDLLESELFGHERGAFSGAVQARKGRVELAEGGTLFLDEIGEMPRDLQSKLLTFLQERSYFSVGGNTLKAADIRIIAASNQDLHQSVAEGRFREDLFYRINVLPLEVPPLRERRGDIPVLAKYFLEQALQSMGVEPESLEFDAGALDAVLHYSWPGNVRELENAMLRAATLMNPKGRIGVECLPPILFKKREESKLATVEFGRLAGLTLEDLERQAIRETLEECGGNKGKAAQMLGISEKSVYNKIRKYELPF